MIWGPSVKLPTFKVHHDDQNDQFIWHQGERQFECSKINLNNDNEWNGISVTIEMSKFSIFLFRNEHFKMLNESLENSLKDVRIFSWEPAGKGADKGRNKKFENNDMVISHFNRLSVPKMIRDRNFNFLSLVHF